MFDFSVDRCLIFVDYHRSLTNSSFESVMGDKENGVKGKTYFYKEPVMCYALNFNRVSSRLIRDYMYSKQTKLKLDRKYQKFSQMGKSLV